MHVGYEGESGHVGGCGLGLLYGQGRSWRKEQDCVAPLQGSRRPSVNTCALLFPRVSVKTSYLCIAFGIDFIKPTKLVEKH